MIRMTRRQLARERATRAKLAGELYTLAAMRIDAKINGRPIFHSTMEGIRLQTMLNGGLWVQHIIGTTGTLSVSVRDPYCMMTPRQQRADLQQVLHL